MNRLRRFERIVPILALIASLAALGIEIQWRIIGRHAHKSPAKAGTSTLAPAPASGPGSLPPLDVPPGTKVVGSAHGESPRMQGFSGGRKQYDFGVEKLYLFPDQRTVGEGIAGGALLDAHGKPTLQFSAERAVMDYNTKNLQVQGQVRVSSIDPKNPVTFVTRDMNWNAREERLICPNPVEVTKPGMILRGAKMTADAHLKKLSLEGAIYIEAEVDQVNKTLGLDKPAGGGAKRR